MYKFILLIIEFLMSFNPNEGNPINTSNTTIRGVPLIQVERPNILKNTQSVYLVLIYLVLIYLGLIYLGLIYLGLIYLGLS